MKHKLKNQLVYHHIESFGSCVCVCVCWVCALIQCLNIEDWRNQNLCCFSPADFRVYLLSRARFRIEKNERIGTIVSSIIQFALFVKNFNSKRGKWTASSFFSYNIHKWIVRFLAGWIIFTKTCASLCSRSIYYQTHLSVIGFVEVRGGRRRKQRKRARIFAVIDLFAFEFSTLIQFSCVKNWVYFKHSLNKYLLL